MKLSQFLLGVALCLISTCFLASCKKEDSNVNTIPEIKTSTRFSGVAADDPALVSKVPMIVSSDFLKSRKGISSINMFAKGRPDSSPPSVNITAPYNNATVSGTINIQATASDNVGVSLVSFSVDASSVASTSSSPYTIPWNSATIANGIHTLTVTARDAAGNSKAVSIQVSTYNVTGGDIINPTVSITSPANGASVSGTVNIEANSTDNVGVSLVSFNVDGATIGTDNTPPYSVSWNSLTIASGVHTLTATSTDVSGNLGSHSIQVMVNTTVIPPGPLPASYSLIMPPVGQQGTEFSCVSWAVASVRSAERYYKTNSTSYSTATNIFSPEYLYNQAKVAPECSSGSGIYTCLNIIKNQGVSTWKTMPYSDTNGCSLMPNSTQTAEAANYKIGSFLLVSQTDEIAIKTLLSQNHSLIAGTSIDANFTNATPGFIWNSFNSPYGTNHGYVICGYDDVKHAYKAMNSWGTGWGDSGFIWIDYDFFGTLPGSVYVMQNAL